MRKILLLMVVVVSFALVSSGICQEEPVVQAGNLPIQKAPSFKTSLPINFFLEKRCAFGDMNALILEAMPGGKEVEVVMTVEPISGGAAPGAESLHVLSDENVMRQAHSGYPLKLDLPTGDGLYGIFICKVSPGASRRCNDKEAADVQRIIYDYLLEADIGSLEMQQKHQAIMERKRQTGVSDKFYFFKPIVVSKGEVFMLTENMSDGLYQKFRDFVKEKGINPAIVEKVQQYDKLIGNLPLVLQNERIKVIMPVYNGVGCAKTP